MRKPLRERRELLLANFKEIEGEFVFAKSMISSNTEDIQVFLDESIKGKSILGEEWLKLKRRIKRFSVIPDL